MSASICWLIVMIVFLVIEAAIPGLVSIWCAIAAAFTAVFAIYCKGLWYQLYFFLFWSVLLFFAIRKFAKSFLYRGKKGDGGVDRITGSIVEIKGISENGYYQVYLDGKNWNAVSDKEFFIGGKAKVSGFKGTKLVLSEIRPDDLEI
ncbi:MAG: NfeD family protein [Fusobacteriaceae bacterium]|jgi:membrane protein implicated in regulation of membrane protease activity|nr:NfeD family protein [Fusobacteriaceae bacterium]